MYIGKVQLVILDALDAKYYSTLGEEDSIGSILFTWLSQDEPATGNYGSCHVARPLNFNLSHYPVRKELVHIFPAPGSEYNNNEAKIWYYGSPISLHQSPQGSPLPGQLNIYNSEYEQGRTFKIREKIQPLRPYEGDITFEGRWGNSIRLGSTTDNSPEGTTHQNAWSNEGELGEPITIIRNGQGIKDRGESFERIIENINDDDSSIYLCSRQQISDFIPASTNDGSYGSAVSIFTTKVKAPKIQNNDLNDNVEEDIVLSESPSLVPLELQTENELQYLEDSETAFYDIAPTEEQIILPQTIFSLPETYIVPAGVNLSETLG